MQPGNSMSSASKGLGGVTLQLADVLKKRLLWNRFVQVSELNWRYDISTDNRKYVT
jgi:hypothetical protein